MNLSRFIPAYAGNSRQCYESKLVTAVHPRLRGELDFLYCNSYSRTGSSPLTRGTRAVFSDNRTKMRFIPAYAGNSGIEPMHYLPSTVHPRLRGELIGGSRAPISTVRFIPAYAGNSIFRPSLKAPRAVHPRLRGELITSEVIAAVSAGSSPLTRGTHPAIYSNVTEIRFIPAYAGNSAGLPKILCSSPVHPRLRGELEPGAKPILTSTGSSPLTRGTQRIV